MIKAKAYNYLIIPVSEQLENNSNSKAQNLKSKIILVIGQSCWVEPSERQSTTIPISEQSNFQTLQEGLKQ